MGHHPDASATAVTMHYPAGWRADPAPHAGLAHLVEHLMFSGSAALGPMEHALLVESRGGEVNATTRPDHVTYHQVLPSAEVELAIWLEAERLGSLRVTPAELDVQRTAVEQEIASSITHQPYGGFPWLLLPPVLFDSFAHGHDGYGRTEDLADVTLPVVRAFLEEHYGPQNAVLTVVGDVPPETVLEAVRRHFGPIPAGPPHPGPAPVRTPPRPRHEERVDDLAPVPATAFGWRTPSPTDAFDDYLAWVLLADVLAAGDDSVLHAALVADDALAVAVNATVGPLGESFTCLDPALLAVEVYHPQEVSASTVRAAVLAQVRRLAEDGPDPEHLDRVRSRTAVALWRAWDQPLGRASLLGATCLFGRPLSRAGRLPSLVRAVGVDEVRRAARRLAAEPPGVLELRSGGAR